MNVTIRKAVGDKPAPNVPEDVRKIQSLLNTVYGRTMVIAHGKCDIATIKAIGNFQRLWPGKVDSRVDPGGRTLRRLNETATPLKLNLIRLGRIKHGGYLISYSGKAPPSQYKVFLSLPLDINSLEITGRKQTDVMASDNLPDLLRLIDKLGLWGKNAQCRLYVKREGRIVTQSNMQSLPCPVQPYSGKLEPQLGEDDTGPALTYTGIQTGRMFYQPAIDGKYYFAYGGKFETDDTMRGFNCITFIGAVCGVDPASGAMGAYGTQLADHVGATNCGMENKKEAAIKDFFKTNKKGTYIMWSSTHSVLVVDAVIHEFSESKGGYVKTDVQKWNYHGKSYWIRKLPKGF